MLRLWLVHILFYFLTDWLVIIDDVLSLGQNLKNEEDVLSQDPKITQGKKLSRRKLPHLRGGEIIAQEFFHADFSLNILL